VYILNLETATRNCSVALAKNGETILCKEIAEIGFSHAEKLHVFIEEIIKEANINFSDLKAIAVSKGPGSYTGLRIGVSAAKGLSFALNIPLISIDTLLALTKQVSIEKGVIIPMIDARRMEVYSAVFDANHNKIRDVEAQILDENSFSDLDQEIYIIGDSSEKAKTILTTKNIIYLDEIQFPSAKQMCKLSFEKFQNNDFEDVAYFEPFYLKDFLITTPKIKN
jgi:tRNA threonylcarbamoyladenosine biosynthesis protein TsaB